MLSTSANRFGAVTQALHWLTVPMLAIAWALGTFDDILPQGQAKAAGLLVHISIGLAILAMLIVRIPFRMASAPPAEPTKFGKWMTVWADPAARITHYILYFLLAAVPVSGIILQFAHGASLPLFGFAEIPSPWAYNRSFAHNAKEFHELTAHALLIIAIFHAIAALIHHFVFRDSTLLRMLPGSRSDGPH